MTIWLSLLAGGFGWPYFSLAIHAVATINFRADHVVSGTVLNLLAPALAVFLVKAIYGKGQTNNIDLSFGKFDFPFLSDIPVIGDIFFKNTSLMGYIAIGFSFVAWFIMFKTKFRGFAFAQLVNTHKLRILSVSMFTSCVTMVCSSLDFRRSWGALYAQSASVNFSATTIVGPGFIALAAMIFGKWSPIGAMLSSLFFGLSQALAVVSTQIPFLAHIPGVYLRIAPYV